jgi:hypothetical protein
MLRRAQEPLDGIARIYSDKLLEQIGEDPFPVAKIVEFNLRAVPDSEDAFPTDETIAAERAKLESAVGPLDGRRVREGGGGRRARGRDNETVGLETRERA